MASNPNSGASPVYVPSSEKVDDEAAKLIRRRLKHREYVKKSYNKKRQIIESLRCEVETLERQYKALLIIPNTSPRQHQEGHEADAPATSSSTRQAILLQRYHQLVELKNQYHCENAELYDRNAEHMKVQGRLQQLVDAASDFPDIPVPYQIQPLPDVEYSKIIADARDDILKFAFSTSKFSTGASVFGWRDQRKIQGDSLKFALEKHFQYLSPYELMERSWQIFSSPERFPLIYGSSLKVKFHVLQYVNPDVVLFYRIIRTDGSPVAVKTLFLLARLKIDQGYMLLFKSIDKDLVHFEEDSVHKIIDEARSIQTSQAQIVATDRKEVWVEKYIWVLFQEVPGSGSCLFHFGGATTTDLWLREVLFIALRWENLAVGPILRLDQ